MAQPEFVSRVRPLVTPESTTNPVDVIDRRIIIFIHIQKTAGTSITNLLEECSAPGKCCPERFNHLHLHSAAELADYELFAGHFDLFSTRYIPGRKKFIFSVFRDPLERLVSFYRFVQTHPKNSELLTDPIFALADQLKLEDYYAHPAVRASRLVNNHYRAVLSGSLAPTVSCAPLYTGTLEESLEALERLDAVGITSRLEESLRAIFPAAGLPAPQSIPRHMVLDDMFLDDPERDGAKPVNVSEEFRRVSCDLIRDDLEIYESAERRVARERHGGN